MIITEMITSKIDHLMKMFGIYLEQSVLKKKV